MTFPQRGCQERVSLAIANLVNPDISCSLIHGILPATATPSDNN